MLIRRQELSLPHKGAVSPEEGLDKAIPYAMPSFPLLSLHDPKSGRYQKCLKVKRIGKWQYMAFLGRRHKKMKLFGNPAVIALSRLRPAALRPRLLASLPLSGSSQLHYTMPSVNNNTTKLLYKVKYCYEAFLFRFPHHDLFIHR